MEHHAQSIEDALIGPLSFKLKDGASYVINRRSVSYFPSGGNFYSSSGVKVCKFNISGDQWLDPQTLRVHFQLNNESDPVLKPMIQPLSWNPAVFFRRARLIGGGQVIEDIDNFARLSLMLTSLESEHEQLSIASEGFCSYDDKYGPGADDKRKSYNLIDHEASGVVRQSRRVLFKPMFGLFNQDKMIPVKYLPLQIELELVSDATDALVTTDGYGSHFSISDAQIKCDLVTLDSSLENEYASHLLSGKSLPINFSSWNHTVQQTVGKDFSLNVSRGLTRLKGVFTTLYLPSVSQPDRLKEANNFYHPISKQSLEGSELTHEHQMWLQVGSNKYPEYPINSCSEAFYHLKKTVGDH
eukprot:5260741-Heterocapsa_arctica.AAC.1